MAGKKKTPTQILNAMLRRATFDELLKGKELYDIAGACLKTGFCEWHLRRLCASRRIAHIKRGSQYFFLPSQLEGVFKSVPARP